MAFDAHANLAGALVVVAPSPATSGTSLTITAGQGAIFPVAPFNCTVCPANTMPTLSNAEIVRVTAIVGDTFTITRAQEGSTAQPIAAGFYIGNSITKKDITDIEDGVNASALAGPITTSGLTMATARLLGRTTGSTGAVEEITVGTGLSLAAGTLSLDASAAVTSVAGTTNQVLVNGVTTPATGAVVLSLPQDIALNSTPTFNGIKLNDLGFLSTGSLSIRTTEAGKTANNVLTLVTGASNRVLTLTGDAILNQDVSTAGSPTFTALSANSLTSQTGTALTLATLDSNANLFLAPHGTGEVIINKNAATAPAGFTGTSLHLNGSDSTATTQTLDTYTGIARVVLRKANTSGAAPSALTSGNNIGRLSWQGRGATVYSTADRAFINVNATENWTDTAQGTAMTLSITDTGGTTAINWAAATPTQISFALSGLNPLIMTQTAFTAAGKFTMTGPGTTVGAGGSNYHSISANLTGDAGGTSDIRAFAQAFTLTGSNNVAFLNGVYASAINAQTGGVVAGLIASTYQTISSNASDTTAVAGAVAFHSMTGTGNVTSSYEGFVLDPPTYSSTGRITGQIVGFSIPLDSGNSATTTWRGFSVSADQTKGSGDLSAFYGNISSGSGKYNLNMAGTAQNLLASGLTTGAPSGGSAGNWKLGTYTAGVAVQAGKVRIDIGGTPYDLLTA